MVGAARQASNQQPRAHPIAVVNFRRPPETSQWAGWRARSVLGDAGDAGDAGHTGWAAPMERQAGDGVVQILGPIGDTACHVSALSLLVSSQLATSLRLGDPRPASPNAVPEIDVPLVPFSNGWFDNELCLGVGGAAGFQARRKWLPRKKENAGPSTDQRGVGWTSIRPGRLPMEGSKRPEKRPIGYPSTTISSRTKTIRSPRSLRTHPAPAKRPSCGLPLVRHSM